MWLWKLTLKSICRTSRISKEEPFYEQGINIISNSKLLHWNEISFQTGLSVLRDGGLCLSEKRKLRQKMPAVPEKWDPRKCEDRRFFFFFNLVKSVRDFLYPKGMPLTVWGNQNLILTLPLKRCPAHSPQIKILFFGLFHWILHCVSPGWSIESSKGAQNRGSQGDGLHVWFSSRCVLSRNDHYLLSTCFLLTSTHGDRTLLWRINVSSSIKKASFLSQYSLR